MNKKVLAIAIILIFSTTIVASNFTVRVRAHPLNKVALIVGGDESDLGFSMMAILGAEAIQQKYPWLTVSISRNVPYTEQRSVAASYGDEGYDLVFCVGGQFMSMLYGWGEDAMPDLYPDTTWVAVPGAGYSDRPNLVALGPAFQVFGHFLAGVLAAKLTQTGHVGWIVGTWYEPGYLCMEANAFVAGVKYADSSVTVHLREVGGTNPWGDPSAGYQIASTLIETYDVDIIAHVADFSGRGVMQACADHGQPYPMVIGCVADQYELSPDNMVTSILMDTPKFMDLIVQYMINGVDLGYKSIDIDLSSLAPFHNLDPYVPQDVRDLLAATEKLIRTDLDFSGVINMTDVSSVGEVFGAIFGTARWKPIADINRDNVIDIRDISIMGRNFGKTFTPVPLNPYKPPNLDIDP